MSKFCWLTECLKYYQVLPIQWYINLKISTVSKFFSLSQLRNSQSKFDWDMILQKQKRLKMEFKFVCFYLFSNPTISVLFFVVIWSHSNYFLVHFNLSQNDDDIFSKIQIKSIGNPIEYWRISFKRTFGGYRDGMAM